MYVIAITYTCGVWPLVNAEQGDQRSPFIEVILRRSKIRSKKGARLYKSCCYR